MIRQLYTLRRIVDNLQELIACELKECYSQEKNTAMLKFFDGSSIRHLQLSTDPLLSSIFLRDNFARARKNSVDLFSDTTFL